MKSKQIQTNDQNEKQQIEFSKEELKILYNSLLIDTITDENVSEKNKNLLQKLDYFINE